MVIEIQGWRVVVVAQLVKRQTKIIQLDTLKVLVRASGAHNYFFSKIKIYQTVQNTTDCPCPKLRTSCQTPMCQLRWPTQQQSHSKRCSIYSPLPLRDWFWWTCKFSDWYFNWYSKLGKHSDKGTLINIVALLFMTRVAEQTVSTSTQYTSSICWAQSKGPILIFNWVSQRSKNVKKECSCCRRWLSHSQPAAHLGTFLGLIICLHYEKKVSS